MDINEIIEAWDKDQLPKSVDQLTIMLVMVAAACDIATKARNTAEQGETREMYYAYRVLMLEIAHTLKGEIEFLKILND